MALQSEYRQNYCGDYDGSRKEIYKEMLSFRNKRKLFELRHTPLIWLDHEGNVNDESISEEVIHTEEKIESPVVIEEQKPVLLHQCKSVQVNETIKKVDVAVQSPFWNDKKGSDARTSARRSARLKLCVSHKKPIIAYGWADNSSLQKKKTFNVKAPITAVRQSALRAEKQREIQKHKQLDKKQRLSEEKLKNCVLIDTLTNFNEWQTEYQRQFCK